MIWDSIFLMTLIDIVIITMGLYAFFITLKWRRHSTELDVSQPIRLMLMGLLSFMLFFLADLITMFVFPMFIGVELSMQLMKSLHLNVAWFLHLISLTCLTAALLLFTKKIFPQIKSQKLLLIDKIKEKSTALKLSNQRLARAMQTTRDTYWNYDSEQKNIWMSRPLISQLAPHQKIAKKWKGQQSEIDLNSLIEFSYDFLFPEDISRLHQEISKQYQTGSSFDVEFRAKQAEQETWNWYRLRGEQFFIDKQSKYHFSGVLQDINSHKTKEMQLMELSIAVENAMQGISKLDKHGFFIEVRNNFANIIGFQPQELIGQHWKETIPESDLAIAMEAYQKMLETGSATSTFRVLKKDTSLCNMQVLMVKFVNGLGEFDGHHCYMKDVSDEIALQQQLSYEASHDALTRLINRREFEKRLANALHAARKIKACHVLCYMDLDQFKVINDTLGHGAGDRLLNVLADTLIRQIRSRDTLARLGGDEFAILMEHCNETQGMKFAEKIQQEIENFEVNWEGVPLKVGVSIGLVEINSNSESTSEILRKADAACYVAKDLGRGRIHIYGQSDRELLRRRNEMHWVARIHDALQNGKLALYLQRIVALDNVHLEYCHFEVLLRMKEGDKIIPPNEFLAAAEKYNIATKIDRWVVSEVFKQMQQNPNWVNKISWVAINLSAYSVVDKQFLRFFQNQLGNYKIMAEKICIEITETAAIDDLDTACKFISELKKLGCKFALDDFGAGFSSFDHLKKLDVDFIKIDGSIVKDIATDEAALTMVKSINRISQIRNKQTIAEYVENRAIKSYLQEIGVNFIQGYHEGKPEPIAVRLAAKECGSA